MNGDVVIVFKKDHAAARSLSGEIAAWLEGEGIGCALAEANFGMTAFSPRAALAIVLGGDGTILGVGRALADKNVPIFGINFGRVGFLTTASPSDWKERLACALAGGYHVRECAILEWRHERNGEVLASGVAINDIVLGHGALARLVGIEVNVDGNRMGQLRCDGLIVCTPLGSTAYNLSAGGPIIYPEMNAIALSPICPFQSGVAPLVFPACAKIELRIGHGTAECYLTIDGQDCVKLRENDSIFACGREKGIKFLGSRRQFFERLRSRGFNLECMYSNQPIRWPE